MLFGVTVGEITFNSKSKGFFAVCCACGWSSYVNITPSSLGYVIIECERDECGQIVHIYEKGSGVVAVESKHVR